VQETIKTTNATSVVTGSRLSEDHCMTCRETAHEVTISTASIFDQTKRPDMLGQAL
jgi:hypothetical protein